MADQFSEDAVKSLPEGWEEGIDPESGQTYYYNNITATSSWDRPIAKVVAVAKVASSWSNKTHTESNATDGGWPSAAATGSSASAIAPSAAATDSSASVIAPAASAASSAGPDQNDAAQTNAMADDSVIAASGDEAKTDTALLQVQEEEPSEHKAQIWRTFETNQWVYCRASSLSKEQCESDDWALPPNWWQQEYFVGRARSVVVKEASASVYVQWYAPKEDQPALYNVVKRFKLKMPVDAFREIEHMSPFDKKAKGFWLQQPFSEKPFYDRAPEDARVTVTGFDPAHAELLDSVLRALPGCVVVKVNLYEPDFKLTFKSAEFAKQGREQMQNFRIGDTTQLQCAMFKEPPLPVEAPLRELEQQYAQWRLSAMCAGGQRLHRKRFNEQHLEWKCIACGNINHGIVSHCELCRLKKGADAHSKDPDLYIH